MGNIRARSRNYSLVIGWAAVCVAIMSVSEPAFGAVMNSCTDCHGMHRMAHRTRRWDKITRKLIKDDGVRMMEERK